MEEVVEVIAPNLTEAKNSGVTAVVVSTPVGVGRRADIDHAVSEAADLPLLVPTGIYREPWIPEWAHEASEAELRDWMIRELNDEIEDRGVQAAWIKVSAGDDGITDTEEKILRAAARAGAETDAVIGSHTVRGTVVAEQLDIIEDAGYRPDRFIWIHTQRDPDFETHLEIAQRGAWIEHDALGSRQFPDFVFTDRIRTLIDVGLDDRLLLSHDGGWYDPSEPNSGAQGPIHISPNSSSRRFGPLESVRR